MNLPRTSTTKAERHTDEAARRDSHLLAFQTEGCRNITVLPALQTTHKKTVVFWFFS